jgi:hypothetical protein
MNSIVTFKLEDPKENDYILVKASIVFFKYGEIKRHISPVNKISDPSNYIYFKDGIKTIYDKI